MEQIPVEDVVVDLVIARAGFSVEAYDAMCQKIKRMSKTEKMKLAKEEDFPNTWKELFEDRNTKWYKTELPSSTEFVNKIFDSGKGFMTHIGLKHSDLIQDYTSKKMPKEHRAVIDRIRKTLFEHPRIIVLTKDFKEYSVFDGGRRAVAFILKLG